METEAIGMNFPTAHQQEVALTAQIEFVRATQHIRCALAALIVENTDPAVLADGLRILGELKTIGETLNWRVHVLTGGNVVDITTKKRIR